MSLEFDQVTKLYGPVIGVNRVCCHIGPGITGLLGANGAGKSTLIKLASGQLRPTQGRVLVDGHSAWSTSAKRRLGYCPDLNRFYEDLSGREFVHLMASLHGFGRREARDRTEAALQLVGMSELAWRRLSACSHGMRQRIKLAQALVHDPEILLLDEPLLGIDPGGRQEIHRLLAELASRGKTLLVSSHILDEIELIVERVVMVVHGRLVANGTLAEIRSLLDNHPLAVELESSGARQLAAQLVSCPEVESVEFFSTGRVSGAGRGSDSGRGNSAAQAVQGLRIRTRQPAQFFQRIGQLARELELEITRLETIDAGADAVFRYLAPGAR